MLTSDENLVDINLEVQYRRANPLDYAFNVFKPEDTLKEVSESAIREVIGRSKLDSVLESGRQEIVARTKELIQRTLDAYKTGLEVTAVNLQDVRVPNEVAPAQAGRDQGARRPRPLVAGSAGLCERFDSARSRRRCPSGAGCAGVSSRARSPTRRVRPSASSKLLTEYERAPGVTRERLYLETIERVLASSKKVILDTERRSGNLVYLPIDKLLEQGRRVHARRAGGDRDDRGHRPPRRRRTSLTIAARGGRANGQPWHF